MPRLLALITAGLLALLAVGHARADDITVFAAASLKNAMDEVAKGFQAETGANVIQSFAGSSALARQIELGAPADVFVSAHPAWMDHLEAAGLIEAETRSDLLSNALVLIAHGRDVEPVVIGPDLDLAGMLGNQRMAMALVDAVPVGIYGKAALQTLGSWEVVASRVVQTDNVRVALALVARGETPLGIVYATDADVEDEVSVIGTFAPETHPPIVYPVAAIAGAANPLVETFIRYLQSPAAGEVFERHGFVVLNG